MTKDKDQQLQDKLKKASCCFEYLHGGVCKGGRGCSYYF